MNKYFEAFMWTICIIVILAVGLSDPIIWAYITEHWAAITAVTLLLAVTATISFLTGYVKGCRDGYADGFKIGVDWK